MRRENNPNERTLEQLRALIATSEALARGAHRSFSEILETVYQQISKLIDADNMYIALYDEATDTIRFGLAFVDGRRIDVETKKGWQPRRAGKGTTEEIIRTRKPLFHATKAEVEAWHSQSERLEYFGRLPASWLGVPMMVDERVLGVIAIYDEEREYAYDEQDLQVISSIANQAAIAIENARLYQNLDRRVQDLEVLTEMSRGAVSNLGIDQILDLVYEQIGKVIDLSDAQVQIAFYDEAKDEVSFPLAIEQDAGEIIDIVRWGKREAQCRGVDEEEKVVEQLKPRARRAPPGLDEYVIRTKQPLLIVEDFEQKATNLGIKVWPTSGRLDRPTHSWLGVPMIVGDRVIGVISIQSLEQERAFDEGQQELLSTIVSQAAVAIENATLFKEKDQALVALREEQRMNLAAGRLAAVNTVAAEFMHKMNNIAGTIPVRVEQIRELLGPSDERPPRISHFLDAINDDIESVLRIARAIRSSDLAEENLELVDIDILVSTAIQRIAIPSEVTINNQCTRGLPQVLAFSGQLVDTLENIIRNGLEAIEGAGTVTISCRKAVKYSQEWVAIEVKDTGRGIPAEDLSKIFSLFFTTKPNGMGFALWRARTLVESLGGSITVSSEVGRGTAFTILLPVA